MAAVRHLWFVKVGHVRRANMRYRGGFKCVIVPNYVEIARTAAKIYGDLSIFSRWRLSAILDLWYMCWDHPRSAFGGLYHCGKFGWNRCSSFDNMHIFLMSVVWRENAYLRPKIVFLGVWTPKWGAIWTNPKNAHPCASPRRLSHNAWKSVNRSDL